MHMQPTFLIGLVLPPPAACTEVFAFLDSTCTGGTANTGVTLVMQWVIGDTMATKEG